MKKGMILVVKSGLSRGIILQGMLVVLAVVLVGCNWFGGGEKQGENVVVINRVEWCNRERTMVFTDDRAQGSTSGSAAGASTITPIADGGTPVGIADWQSFKNELGFVVYLPQRLPAGSCLLSASGFVHNVMAGNTFTLTYLLPDRSSLTLVQSEQQGQSVALQCSTLPEMSQSAGGAQKIGVRLCSGTKKTTSITFSADWDGPKLLEFFQQLEADPNWLPHG